jgi:putative zinc finger protein
MTPDGKEDSMSHVDEGTLHSYLDGELPASERASVEAHLAQCAACGVTLGEARALLERASTLLGSAGPIERPAPPFEQLRRAPRRSPWRIRTSFAWAASIVMALGLGYYLRDSERSAAPTSALFIQQQPAAAEDRVAAAPGPAVGALRQEPRAAPPRPAERRLAATPRTDAGAAAEKSVDSLTGREPPAAAPGALALNRSAQLRNATPAQALSETAAAKASLAREEGRDLVSIRGRAGTTQWQVISRGTARTLLGTDPVGLPGLATRTIRRSLAPDATVVVEQTLDSATVIQIFQRPASPPAPAYYVDGYVRRDSAADAVRRQGERAPAAAAIAKAPADRLARFVGRLRVEISGPLSPDSLNKLLEQVEPLP